MVKKVLGVKIDDITKIQAWEKIVGAIGSKTNNFIVVTPGPEFLLTAQKDPEFKKILNNTDLSLPDGFGLNLYAGIKNRIPGTDLMIKLLEESAKNGWIVGLVAKEDGLTSAKEMAQILKKKFGKIKVTFGPPCDLLLVAMGHPDQEKYLQKLKIQNSKFKIGMGVGGGFDYYVGRLPRAPKWVRNLGLEWFIRFLNQPKRIKRILKATVVFPISLLLDKNE